MTSGLVSLSRRSEAVIRIGRKLRWVSCGALLTASLGWTASDGMGQSQPAEPSRGQSKGPRQVQLSARPGEPTTKLGFFNTSWPAVLRRVAEETESTLVMDRVPPGRFTRRDTNSYSRRQAIEILNQELAEHDFRLIEKGKFIVVLELKKARSEYYRNELPARDRSSEPADLPPTPNTAQRLHRNFETLSIPERGASGRRPSRIQSGRIQQAAYEDGSGSATPSDGTSDVKAIRLVPTRHSARDIARTIFGAYRQQAVLVDDGPQGLPAFQVYAAANDEYDPVLPDGERPVLFAIGIDTESNRLAVAADPNAAMQVAKLIAKLDNIELGDGQTVRLVAANEREIQIAEQLRPQLDRLIAQNPAPGANIQQPPGGTAGATDPTMMLLDALRGNVDVEVVPGGIIIKGNQADIDALMKVINQIEEFSRGAVPSINILRLRNVNAEALSQLLTSVYDQLNTLQARGGTLPQRIAFIPIVRPNAIIVLAPKNDMPAVLELADELDQPVDSETEFEVFYLKNAVAGIVAQRINDIFGQQTPGQATTNLVGLSQRVTAFADVRSNAIIARGRANDLNDVASLIEQLDRPDNGTVTRMRMFVLKHAVAEELANVINLTIQSILGPPGQSTTQTGGGGLGGAGQLPQDLQEARSTVLEFLNDSDVGVELVRSGVLSDIRVTTDARTNTVIVTAPESSMPLMEALIHKLDQSSATVAEIKVFTLENSDATAMSELLQTLFDPEDAAGGDGQQLQVQIAGAEDASSSLVPLRFSVDIRTNTIVAVGGAEALRVVEAILLRLDQSDMRSRQNSIVRLKNAPVADVSTAINQFLTSQRELSLLDSELVSNVELLEREVIVVPEPINNTLLISATPLYYDEIMKIILKLDEAPEQVIIQALLVEVELDNTDEFGVELGFQDSVLFNRSLLPQDLLTTVQSSEQTAAATVSNTQIISAEASPGFLFNNSGSQNPLGNNLGPNAPINKGRVGAQSLSNFSLGRINNDLGYGGLVLSASSDSVSVLLRALSANRTVNVLSRPQIRTIDNQFSQIVVGQSIQWISNFQQNNVTGGFTPLSEERNVGIILQVTPRISPDGTIVMETHAEKSRVNFEEGIPLIFDPVTNTQITSPVIDVTIADTTVAVPSGQTAVIGGMITKSDAVVEKKVPWFGDIPVLGVPFRYDMSTTERTELLIFLTPRVIRDDEDSEMIKQIEAERLHFVVEDAESIHGPIFSLPAQMNSGPAGSMTPPPPAPGVMGDDFNDVPSSSITPSNSPRLMTPDNASAAYRATGSTRASSSRRVVPVSGRSDEKPRRSVWPRLLPGSRD